MRWIALLVFLCFEGELAAVNTANARSFSVEDTIDCNSEKIEFLKLLISHKMGEGSKKDTITKQSHVLETCNIEPNAVNGTSFDFPLIASALMTSFQSIVHSFSSRKNSPEMKSHSALLEDTMAVQLQTPLLLYLSPGMWWVRSDPGFTSCYAVSTVLYMISWIFSGLFLTQAQLTLEAPARQQNLEHKRLTFAAIATVASSVLYAVVINRCAVASGSIDCRSTARTRYNFVWPSLMMLFYGYVTSSEIPKIDSDIDGFVSYLKATKLPFPTWDHGRALMLGKSMTAESVTATSPSRTPTRFEDYSTTFQLGLVWFLFSFGFFVIACNSE